jgi:hypothetical protein
MSIPVDSNYPISWPRGSQNYIPLGVEDLKYCDLQFSRNSRKFESVNIPDHFATDMDMSIGTPHEFGVLAQVNVDLPRISATITHSYPFIHPARVLIQ